MEEPGSPYSMAGPVRRCGSSRGGRRNTSLEQLTILIDFMESHTGLALGRVRTIEARATSTRLWAEVTQRLNEVGPATKSAKEWSKTWSDWKSRTRNKVAKINQDYCGTGGGPSCAIQLTPLEDRLASIIGRDVGPIPGVRIDPFHPMPDLHASPNGTAQTGPPAIDNSRTMTISDDSVSILQDLSNSTVVQMVAEPSPITTQVEFPDVASSHARTYEVGHQPRREFDRASEAIQRIEEMRAMASANKSESAKTQSDAVNRIANSLEKVTDSLCNYLSQERR